MSVSLFATRPGAELFSFKGSLLCFRRGLTSRVRDLDGGEEIRVFLPEANDRSGLFLWRCRIYRRPRLS